MNSKLILGILGGVLGLGLVVAIAISATSGGSVNEADVFGQVTVDGPDLPTFDGATANDVAVGMTAPTVTGTDFDGSTVTIGPDGRSKVVILLAHWCPHCQAEVPRIVSWLGTGSKPADVDFYSVSTLVARVRGNWPPQQWLEGEGWPLPVIQDDRNNSAASAFGLSSTPLWVLLDGDNNVIARVAGEVPTSGLSTLFQTAAAG
ncbi:MAG: TlpA disulfide reductase family protein [Acidimicrobiia bacterium]